jgi:hypothetical protein
VDRWTGGPGEQGAPESQVKSKSAFGRFLLENYIKKV